ncbi:hypothetical protein M436DRAFT_82969 [Aureobasidium namibiae CBS 147.97]|uniref:Uncharacterized protein n=1 Tax=Aureobasidium namibiae CBS 147.97 TaxID=1043004 RepID=A0A074WQT8_9PEZI
MESPQADTAAVQTPSTTKTKAGKLKTYAKQRASSASKPMRSSARIRAASEEIGEQHTPARPDIPQTIDETTPVQAKAARKTRKRKADPAASADEEAMAEDAAVEEPAEKPAKTRKRRSKKQSIQPEEEQGVEVPETQEPAQEQVDENLEDPAAEPEQLPEDAAEDEPEAEAGALDAEPEDPLDNTEGDVSQFEVPADSDNDDEEQPQSSSAKPKTKRKRQSVENGSPAPAVKRVKRSSMPRSSVGDYPEQGPFTPVECDLIESHMVDFCRHNELSRDQLIAMIQASSREMSKVYVDLATEVLPHRNRRAVQRYCRRHYNNFQRGRWTDEQDELLRTAYAETPNKWVKIGERVGRMPEDCRDRWRNHVSLDQRHTDVWTQDEEHRLAAAVSECLRAVQANMETTFDRDQEDDFIAWNVVVQKMNGSRNRLQCSMKWRKIKARVLREEAAQRERAAAIERGEIVRDEEDMHSDGMTSPHTTTRWKAEAQRRFDEMTVGDMLDVTRETLYGAQMGAFSSKNTFWAVVTRLHGGSPWTTADRKVVYRRLKDSVGDLQDFKTNLEAQVDWLENSFSAEALAVRSAPKHRPSQGGRRSTGTFRSEEKVQESDDEGELTMPSLGVEQQIDAEMAEAVAHAGAAEQEMELNNGNGNGYTGEQEEDEDVEEQGEPEVPESEHEEADYE